MDAPVVAEMAWALTRAGHATLRFNYRGVGASSGQQGAPSADEEDLEAAVEHLVDTAGPCTALCGVGHGALATLGLLARGRRLAGLVLLSPEKPGDELEGALARLVGRGGGLPPVLLVSGALDPRGEESSESIRELLGGSATAEVVAGADHTFSSGLTDLGRRVARFIAESEGS